MIVFRPKPKIPHGSSRWRALNGTLFIIPSILRSTTAATPNKRDSPIKCKVSQVGQTHGVVSVSSPVSKNYASAIYYKGIEKLDVNQPGMLGIRMTFFKPHWARWLEPGVIDWYWSALERLNIPLMALAFGLLIVFLVVGGSLWIMSHLNQNMPPPMDQIMQMQR